MERLEQLALEAAKAKPAVYVTQGPALRIARKLPGTTPVVFGNSGDLIDAGVAQSLARPGGRCITFLSYPLAGKRVEFLHEIAPKARRLAVVSNPDHFGDAKEFSATREAALGLKLEVSHYPASNPAQLESALERGSRGWAEALVVHPDALMVQQRAALGRFTADRRIPAISGVGGDRRGRVPAHPWTEPAHVLPAACLLRRPGPARGQSGGHPDRAAEHRGAGGEPEDGEGARHHRAAVAAAARRSRDRVNSRRRLLAIASVLATLIRLRQLRASYRASVTCSRFRAAKAST